MNQYAFVCSIGAVFSIPVILAIFVPAEYSWVPVMAGVPLFCAGFFLDVRSTISFGIDAVIKYEMSPVFSRLCRLGFARAVAALAAIEVGLVFALSMLLARLEPVMIGMLFAVMGAIHMVGWAGNRRRARMMNAPN